MTRTSASNPSEEELIAALQSGDQKSFEIFYNRFSAVLYGTLISWVNDAHTAENLLQDAFVKAWANRESYDPSKGRLFTWLYNITRNVCIDYYRSRQYKKGKASILSDDVASMLNLKLSNQVPDTIGVRNMLGLLRKEEKQVVELMYFRGYTQKEIARMMHMPIGTVKTRVSMAIKNLRTFFNNDWKQAEKKLALHN